MENRLMDWVRGTGGPFCTSLNVSGIPSIPAWILVVTGFAIGLLSGFLGVGGGFVLMPLLVYLIGAPTSVAVGTSLFHMMFVAAFGTLTHALKGNVDPMLVVLLLVGSIPGARIGASLTKKTRGANIRYWFSLVVYASAVAVLVKLVILLTGHGQATG